MALGDSRRSVTSCDGELQLTKLGDAADRPASLALAIVALALMAIAIVLVLKFATPVLRVPYADLSDVSNIRREHLGADGVWSAEHARQAWERANQTVAATTGGQLENVPDLHKRLRALRQGVEIELEEADRLSTVARIVVAVANRLELARRFELLKNVYIGALVLVLAAATLFAGVTNHSEELASVDSPIPIHVWRESGAWPGPLRECERPKLTGVAVSGEWPHPVVVVPPGKGCSGGVIKGEFVVVPFLKLPGRK